ncbi:unnamed protein product [Triticum turgidum subsp. durum]|uniref:Uncharacterized protein n=1 Tax=Triticum turgidum subsp. durum TaxID=4567 RepID=A0A9R0Q277_TRITD|nr:unnamed protein product [Triticum turgidum subsp. durum]
MANGDVHEINGRGANTEFISYNTCIRSTGVVLAVIPSKCSFSERIGFDSSGSSGSRSFGEVLDDSNVFGVTRSMGLVAASRLLHQETERRCGSRASRGDGAGRRRSAHRSWVGQRRGLGEVDPVASEAWARRSFELEAADGIHGHGCFRSFATGAQTRQGTGARGRWRRALANTLARDACGRELLPVRSAGDEADEGGGRGERDEGVVLLGGLDSPARAAAGSSCSHRRRQRETCVTRRLERNGDGRKGERRREARWRSGIDRRLSLLHHYVCGAGGG